MFHFHSNALVIFPKQQAALRGYSEMEAHASAYMHSILPCAMAPTLNTAGVSTGSEVTISFSGTTLGELWENATRWQPAGKCFVTGPLITCSPGPGLVTSTLHHAQRSSSLNENQNAAKLAALQQSWRLNIMADSLHRKS